MPTAAWQPAFLLQMLITRVRQGNVELDGAGIVLEDAVINVTSQKAKASGIIGSQKVSNAVLVNVKGNLDLTVTSEGAQAQAVSMAGGFASLGADGKVVNITANSKNSRGWLRIRVPQLI